VLTFQDRSVNVAVWCGVLVDRVLSESEWRRKGKALQWGFFRPKIMSPALGETSNRSTGLIKTDTARSSLGLPKGPRKTL
jgi:hypothetical protein